MRTLLFVCCLLVPGILWSEDRGPTVPWKVLAGVGLWLPSDDRPWSPFLEVGGFVQALDPPGPEFFDVGARGSWGPEGWSGSVGVRHKLYFVPWASSNQEVMVGWGTRAGRGAWLLSGRFGASLPWDGVDRSHPPQSSDLALVWDVALDPVSGVIDSGWGLAVGLGLGPGAP